MVLKVGDSGVSLQLQMIIIKKVVKSLNYVYLFIAFQAMAHLAEVLSSE